MERTAATPSSHKKSPNHSPLRSEQDNLDTCQSLSVMTQRKQPTHPGGRDRLGWQKNTSFSGVYSLTPPVYHLFILRGSGGTPYVSRNEDVYHNHSSKSLVKHFSQHYSDVSPVSTAPRQKHSDSKLLPASAQVNPCATFPTSQGQAKEKRESQKREKATTVSPTTTRTTNQAGPQSLRRLSGEQFQSLRFQTGTINNPPPAKSHQ